MSIYFASSTFTVILCYRPQWPRSHARTKTIKWLCFPRYLHKPSHPQRIAQLDFHGIRCWLRHMFPLIYNNRNFNKLANERNQTAHSTLDGVFPVLHFPLLIPPRMRQRQRQLLLPTPSLPLERTFRAHPLPQILSTLLSTVSTHPDTPHHPARNPGVGLSGLASSTDTSTLGRLQLTDDDL